MSSRIRSTVHLRFLCFVVSRKRSKPAHGVGASRRQRGSGCPGGPAPLGVCIAERARKFGAEAVESALHRRRALYLAQS
jgi:hypothetical protein